MSTSDVVRVTKKFHDDFNAWAEDRIMWKDFTRDEIDAFKVMLRKDITPGPDQLRDGLTVIKEAGIEVPAMIDDYKDRIKYWSDYFHEQADIIRARYGKAA